MATKPPGRFGRRGVSRCPDDSQDMPIKNAPPLTFTVNTLEARTVPSVGAGKESMRMSGQNNGGFETRVTQEQGTH